MPENIKFLLVDDLEANLIALEGLLRRDGLELLRAKSGAEALELLLLHDIALAILDVQMPGMDGFELAELMRGTERTRRVPIIFVTAGAVDQSRRFRGYEAGAVDFIFKPIEPHILQSKTGVFYELACQRVALQRSVEEAQAASRAKDDFLAALSHELRTPLAPVLLSAGALATDPSLPPEARQQMVMIQRNIELEARLIDDLLDLTRISRGKLPYNPELTDAHALLLYTEEIVRSELTGARQLQLSLDAADYHVMADPARLQQVFWNLMKNAVKFSEPDGHVRLRSFNRNGSLVVEVQDDGIGIAPEAIGRIFDPFDQGELGHRHRFGGLGLGLSISKAVIDLHGGKLKVTSPGIGGGATFSVALQTVKQPAAKPSQPSPAAAGGEPRPSLRLLIAEDHDAARITMTKLLERDGHRVFAASCIAEAMAHVEQQEFDIVISDLGLPDGSGLDLMRMIKQKHGWPGIALSGYGMESDVRASHAAGFSMHLVKPVDVASLRGAIARMAAG